LDMVSQRHHYSDDMAPAATGRRRAAGGRGVATEGCRMIHMLAGSRRPKRPRLPIYVRSLLFWFTLLSSLVLLRVSQSGGIALALALCGCWPLNVYVLARLVALDRRSRS